MIKPIISLQYMLATLLFHMFDVLQIYQWIYAPFVRE
jgi:hypothetical protein